MILKKTSYLLILCLVFGIKAYSQQDETKQMKKQSDSIKLMYLTEAAVRAPILRQVVVSNTITGASDFKSKLKGEDLFEGKLAQARTNVLITLPFVSWGKNTITGTMLYQHQQFMFSDIKVANPSYQNDIDDRNIYRNSLGLNVGFQRIDSLFGKNIVYTANINGLSGKKGSIQQYNFIGAAILSLKQTPKSSLSVGLALNIDRSINIPVFPIVTYWYKFDSGYEFNINLPQQVMLRKEFSPKIAATVGTNFTAFSSFFQSNNLMSLPNDLNYTELGLQNGIGMEYRLTKKVIIGLNAGLQTPLSSRAFEVGKNANDYYIKNKMDSSPYVKLSVSLLPIISSVF